MIVGGGPAGLSAALILGRCLRHVLVVDSATPRNRHSHQMHGYLSRDGVAPADFLHIAREELGRYQTVEVRSGEVVDASRETGEFRLLCSDGRELRAARLLLATGVRDDVPAIDGCAALYGRSVHHCPYCDAWEWRGRRLAVYGKGGAGVGLAVALTVWSDDVALCTDAAGDLDADSLRQLAARRISVRRERVVSLEGENGQLRRVIFDSGPPLDRDALFFCTGQSQSSDLAVRLGCRLNEQGTVETGKCESTNVPGLFVCGDASKDAQFVIVAAAEGAQAAVAINQSLADTRAALP